LVEDLPPSENRDYLKSLTSEAEESLKQVEKCTKRAVSNPHDDDIQKELQKTFTDHKVRVALIQSELSQVSIIHSF
jgi:hypothetical protein